jgi:signal transduction histidine kinase
MTSEPVFGTPESSQETQNLVDSFLECAASAHIGINSEGRICHLNAGAEKMFGVDASSLMGRSYDLLPAALRSVVQEVTNGRSGVFREAVPFLLPGSNLISQVEVIFLSGSGLPVVMVCQNLRPLEKIKETIRRLERLASMGTFSAGMAHEIKNALVAIKTFVQRAEEREEAEFTAIATREIRRIDSIIGQMLKFAGPAKPVFSRLNIHRLAEQALRTVHSQLESKTIQVQRSYAAASDLVNGDEFQLEQALVNLFINAAAAMSAGGTLSIGTRLLQPGETEQVIALQERADSTHLEISISDTGEGIEPSNMGRLFEPFFTTKPDGTGLGLSITRRIIQEHGGEIRVESQPNEGTKFTFVLPLGS